MDDEREPLFDDYARSDRSSNHKTKLAVLGVLCLFLAKNLLTLDAQLAGTAVTGYMWHRETGVAADLQHDLDLCHNGSAPQPSPNPNPNPNPQPTPQPTAAGGYPATWSAIAETVLTSMNRSVDPCDDFYAYACGGWLAANPLPEARARWARAFDKLAEITEGIEQTLAESQWPLLDEFYGACMDVAGIDAAGVPTPVRSTLQAIAAANVSSAHELGLWLGRLASDGVQPVFAFGAGADGERPNRTIAQFDQGGRLLPTATYLKEDGADALTALAHYAETLFTLMGAPFNASASDSADAVVQLQVNLAQISLDRDARRDPHLTYNKIGLPALQNLTQSVDFTAMTGAAGVRKGWNTAEVNVADVGFFKQLDQVVGPLIDPQASNGTLLRDTMAFFYVHSFASALPAPFREAHFNFSRDALGGADKMPPRERYCLNTLDSTELGMLMGHYFVLKEFDQAKKDAASDLVDEIKLVFGERMKHVEWLAKDQKALDAAEFKLHHVADKIGYPDQWDTFSHLTLQSGNHFENLAMLRHIAAAEDAAKVDTATDKGAWEMVPQQINAYYDPTTNQMVFPAGILRGSFYNADAPGALNYGGIGGVMGHELTHGFDDQGSQYDAFGALHSWWPNATRAAFDTRVQCVKDLYNTYTVQSGNETIPCNGNVTIGENLADFGGIANGWRAYMYKLKNDTAFAKTEELIPKAFDGLTKEQLYFVAWGQNWCTQYSTAALKAQIASDVHSPGPIRVLGPVSQFDEFAKAYNCPANTTYNPPTRCSVW